MTREQSIVINFDVAFYLIHVPPDELEFSVQLSEVFIENLFFFVLLASVGAQIPFSIELKLLRRNQSLFYTYLRSVELYRVLKLRLYQCFDFLISFPTKTFDNRQFASPIYILFTTSTYFFLLQVWQFQQLTFINSPMLRMLSIYQIKVGFICFCHSFLLSIFPSIILQRRYEQLILIQTLWTRTGVASYQNKHRHLNFY